jgi:hypothetical protein
MYSLPGLLIRTQIKEMDPDSDLFSDAYLDLDPGVKLHYNFEKNIQSLAFHAHFKFLFERKKTLTI